MTQSLPAPEEPLPSSEGTARPPNEGGRETNEEEEDEGQAAIALQQIPLRRGLWDWARAGTGRLNIIGRIPHPEWRGPVSIRNQESATNGATIGGNIYETQDDFSIPSATTTRPDDAEQHCEAANAKLEGVGILQANITSPSFAQTKQSSDDLIATASSTGSPAWQRYVDEHWTNGETTTPSAASKDSPPSTPDTPTPQQRRKGMPTEKCDAPTHDSPTPQCRTDQPPKLENASATGTPKAKNGAGSDDTPTKLISTPKSNMSARTSKIPKNTSSPRLVPTYKIALAPKFLSPATTGTAST
jgi:hypothetical protein